MIFKMLNMKNIRYAKMSLVSFTFVLVSILETFVFHASRFPSFEGRRKFHRA